MASCGSFSAFTTTQKTLRSKEKLTNGRFLTTQRSGKRREEFLSKIFTSRGVAEVLFALERAHLRLLFFDKIAAILSKILSVKIFFLACESTLLVFFGGAVSSFLLTTTNKKEKKSED